jgi:hypothetical protein
MRREEQSGFTKPLTETNRWLSTRCEFAHSHLASGWRGEEKSAVKNAIKMERSPLREGFYQEASERTLALYRKPFKGVELDRTSRCKVSTSASIRSTFSTSEKGNRLKEDHQRQDKEIDNP